MQDDHSEVADAALRYFACLSEGRADDACALLTPRLRREFTDAARADLGVDDDCPQLLARLVGTLPPEDRRAIADISVSEVGIDGDRAAVIVPGTVAAIPLRRIDGAWLISGMPYPSRASLAAMGVAQERPLGESAGDPHGRLSLALLGDERAGGDRFARWVLPADPQEPPQDAGSSVRDLVVAVASPAGYRPVGMSSDGRQTTVVVGDLPAELTGSSGVQDLVRSIVASVGVVDPAEVADIRIDADVLVALWSLGAAGLTGPGVVAARAEEILDDALARPATGAAALGTLVEQRLLRRDGDTVRVGEALRDWSDALDVDEHLEVVSDDLSEPLPDGPDRVLFVGPPGRRVTVVPPVGGDDPSIRLLRADRGELEALLLRMLGTPAWPTLAEAFAASAVRWRSDAVVVEALIEAGRGTEALPDEPLSLPAERAPLIIAADLSTPDFEHSCAWQVWPDVAVEIDDGPEAGEPGAFSPDDLLPRVFAFCGLNGERPRTDEPEGEAVRVARIVCLHGTGDLLEGGSITWLLDGENGLWLLDDERGTGDPVPEPCDAAALGRLLLDYLPGGTGA